MPPESAFSLFLIAMIAAVLTLALILLLMPVWRRWTLASPNARSSHRIPTPQGAGMAIIPAVLMLVWAWATSTPQFSTWPQILSLTVSLSALTILGAWDDIDPLPAGTRLLVQALAAAAILFSQPKFVAILTLVPAWISFGVLLLGMIWFINLVNFMDGLDWITAAFVAPLAALVAIMAAKGVIAPLPGIVAASLCGAMIAFAFFNKPVAQLFLGDSGSLPLGLACAYLCMSLAQDTSLIVAILPALYHVSDATITLARRALRRENLTVAHRQHFYQRARDRGLSVYAIVLPLLVLNILLCALAAYAATVGWAMQSAILIASICAVATFMWYLETARSKTHA